MDPFVLLAPFIIAPMVLLFVFIGCQLSHAALPVPPTLQLSLRIDPGVPFGRAEFTMDVGTGAPSRAHLDWPTASPDPAAYNLTVDSGAGVGNFGSATVGSGTFQVPVTTLALGRWTVSCAAWLRPMPGQPETPVAAAPGSSQPTHTFVITYPGPGAAAGFWVRADPPGTPPGTIVIQSVFGY